jgi:hypothetical protein
MNSWFLSDQAVGARNPATSGLKVDARGALRHESPKRADPRDSIWRQ